MVEKETFDVFKNVLQTPPVAPEIDTIQIDETQTIRLQEDEPVIETNLEEEVIEDVPVVASEDTDSIKVITQHFADKGALTGFDPESIMDMDDEEAFETAISSTVEAKIKEYKDSIPEEARYLLEYLENGGDPRAYADMMARPDYAKLDIKAENNQKRVIRDYLSAATRLTPEQIERKIERYVDTDTLESEATDALEELKFAQEQEREYMLKQQAAQKEAAQKSYDEYLTKLKADINTKKDIGGFSISEPQKAKLYEHMTRPVTKDGKTQLILNSEKDPDIMLKYAYLDMIGWDINKLTKFVETKVTKSLKDKLKSGDTITKIKGSSSGAGDTFDAFKSALGK